MSRARLLPLTECGHDQRPHAHGHTQGRACRRPGHQRTDSLARPPFPCQGGRRGCRRIPGSAPACRHRAQPREQGAGVLRRHGRRRVGGSRRGPSWDAPVPSLRRSGIPEAGRRARCGPTWRPRRDGAAPRRRSPSTRPHLPSRSTRASASGLRALAWRRTALPSSRCGSCLRERPARGTPGAQLHALGGRACRRVPAHGRHLRLRLGAHRYGIRTPGARSLSLTESDQTPRTPPPPARPPHPPAAHRSRPRSSRCASPGCRSPRLLPPPGRWPPAAR